jgi:predicted transglutaminase-like cysteine proteinase
MLYRTLYRPAPSRAPHWQLLSYLLGSMLLGSIVFVSAAMNNEKLERNMQARYGSAGVNQLHEWQQLLANNRAETELIQIKNVNNFFNAHISFEEDIVHWQQSDYWATPLETLGSGAGDCEDYTIAKYMTLLQLGMPTERLRLIYVKAQIGGTLSHVFQAHMVLGYYSQPNAVPFILDSLVSTIELASRRNDLHPVFSFNSDGLWVGGQAQINIDPTARLSRWRDVLTRMKQEGF